MYPGPQSLTRSLQDSRLQELNHDSGYECSSVGDGSSSVGMYLLRPLLPGGILLTHVSTWLDDPSIHLIRGAIDKND